MEEIVDVISMLRRQSSICLISPSPVDRFVSRRAGVDHQAMRCKMYSDRKDHASKSDDMFTQVPQSWRLRHYANLLGERCGVPEDPAPPLLRHTQGGGRARLRPEAAKSPGWCCAPRKKPVILQPDVIFDLPGYEEYMHNDILDWGKKDFLVAGLGDQVFMMDSSSNHVFKLHTFDPADTILVVKWDPEGRFIAIGTLLGNLFVYDVQCKKLVSIPAERYRAKTDDVAAITSLAWEANGLQMACCTSSGSLSICIGNDDTPYSVKSRAHDREIINCTFSPDSRYVVTCGVDCSVRIWCLPDLKPFFQIVYGHPARALAWHPWRTCQIAVGGGLGPSNGYGDGSLCVWDVSLETNVCHQLPTTRCGVDALSWSHLTGELVISYWIEEKHTVDDMVDGHSRLLVLSAPGKVADEMRSSTGRTRALLFSPDGTKIGPNSVTAGRVVTVGGEYDTRIRQRTWGTEIDEPNFSLHWNLQAHPLTKIFSSGVFLAAEDPYRVCTKGKSKRGSCPGPLQR